jgi:hypothetical protein
MNIVIIEINVIHVHKVLDAHRLYSMLDLLHREGVHSVWGTMSLPPRSIGDMSTRLVNMPIQIDRSIGDNMLILEFDRLKRMVGR